MIWTAANLLLYLKAGEKKWANTYQNSAWDKRRMMLAQSFYSFLQESQKLAVAISFGYGCAKGSHTGMESLGDWF
jgi:hypothetical protein